MRIVSLAQLMRWADEYRVMIDDGNREQKRDGLGSRVGRPRDASKSAEVAREQVVDTVTQQRLLDVSVLCAVVRVL